MATAWVTMLGCGGASEGNPDAVTTSDGAVTDTADANPTAPHAGTVLSTTIAKFPFKAVAAKAPSLYQMDIHVLPHVDSDVIGNNEVATGFGDARLSSPTTLVYWKPREMFSASLGPATLCKVVRATHQLDTTFGRQGCAVTPNSDASPVVAVPDLATGGAGYVAIIQPRRTSQADKHFGVVHITANGSMDTTFGTGGVRYPVVSSTTIAAISAMGQSDGKIVISGQDAAALGSLFLFRIDRNGDLDTTFGTNGFVPNVGAGDVVVLPDDTILLSAHYNGRYELMRFTANGAPLASFGQAGVVAMRSLTNSSATSAVGMTSTVVDAQGRIVMTWARRETNADPFQYFVSRVLSNGQLDPTFGVAGVVSDFGGIVPTLDSGIDIDGDGTILVGLDGDKHYVVKLQP